MSTSMENLSSLYVGDLDPSVTGGQLLETFCKIEGCMSAVLCTDSITGSSLCYGYVNFLTNQQARDAIETMNHKLVNGKEIRVTWSERDSEARKSGMGNIFVKNLDVSVDNSKLYNMFREYGNILCCKVAMSEKGKSNGYGFVRFESDEVANKVIQTVNGTIIDGKEIYVSRFIKKSERMQANSEATTYTNLYVKNLDSDLTEDLLRQKFSEFGEITSLVISKDENGVSKGFGFVNFSDSDDAKRAKESMHGLQLGSKVIYVARAQTIVERQRILSAEFEQRQRERSFQKHKGLNVYIKHINDDVDDNQLKNYFNQCGTVTSAKVMRDDDKGISRGFGFVSFSTSDEATKAINTLNGIKFHGKPLYVAIAQTKEERKAYFHNLYNTTLNAGLVVPFPLNFGYQLPWRPNGFSPLISCPVVGPGFQPPPFSMQYRERMDNRDIIPRHGAGAAYPMPFPQEHNQYPHSHRKSANYQQQQQQQQRAGKRWNNGHSRLTMNNGELTIPSAVDSCSTKTPKVSEEDLSTKLAAASVEDRKKMLGEHLYPLVQKLQSDHLATKITGMLLEMDNAELLLLLESPESLAMKVEEAVQVLDLHQNKASQGESETPVGQPEQHSFQDSSN